MVEVEQFTTDLDEMIDDMKMNIISLEPGTKEHTSAVEDLDRVYRLKLEQIKIHKEYDEKWHRRVMDTEAHEDDMKARRYDRIVKIGHIVAPLLVGGTLTVMGIVVDRDGYITSNAVKGLFNQTAKLPFYKGN